MDIEYYGATAGAQASVNQILGLKATGHEQDWEFEFADPKKIDVMLDIFERKALDLDVKSALCLLIIATFEELFESGEAHPQQIDRASRLIKADSDVLARMRFYWITLGRSDCPRLTGRLLAVVPS